MTEALDAGGPEVVVDRGRGKSPAAFRTISEVSAELDVPPHVLRFWESKFPQIRPLKRGGGRRYYRPEDVELLRRIRALLYKDGYTIKGVQKLLRAPGTPGGEAESGTPVMPGLEPEGDEEPGDEATLAPERRQEIEAAIAELESIRQLLRAAAG